jgi:hypothetical protein
MNRREAVAAIALAPVAVGQTKKSDVRERFIGVWKLVSYEATNKSSGAVSYPLGPKQFGRLTYDAAGRMSAQLMNPGRRAIGGSPERSAVAAARGASCEEIREMLTGFSAYCGRFEVDESSRTVTHRVEACLIPSWVGSAQHRQFEFADNQLILTSAKQESVGRLVWQREEN